MLEKKNDLGLVSGESSAENGKEQTNDNQI